MDILTVFDPLMDNTTTEMREIMSRVEAEEASRHNEQMDTLATSSEFSQDLSTFYQQVLKRKNNTVRVRLPMRLPRHVRQEDAERVPCITSTYEDHFLRAPHEGELACIKGQSCLGLSPDISGFLKHRGKVLVEFRTPDLVQRDKREGNQKRNANLCVLCTRLAVATLYLKSLPGNSGTDGAFYDQINEYCNPVDVPDGYKSELTLPPPSFSASEFDASSGNSRLVGSVCFLKLSLLEWKQDENDEWWIDQSRCKYIMPRTVCIAPRQSSD